MSIEYAPQFESIVSKARAEGKRMRVALAGADSESILRGVFEAEADGFVEPILIGNFKRIQEMTERIGVTGRSYDLQPLDDSTNVVQYAIEMIKAGSADCLMRGDTSTRDFLMPVLNKANHLIKPDALVTHVVFLKVPDYVTLMWCDDNYGYITRLSDAREQQRSGGAGVYYHLSYWGRPHDYLWLTTTQPGLVYNEMRQAYDHNARRLWIANVHDPKVAAYDLELFLDMAWNINAVSSSSLGQHLRSWLCRQFGKEAGERLFPVMHEFYRLCGIRRPEFMGWTQVELDKKVYPRGLSPVSDIPLTPQEAATRIADFERIKTTVSESRSLIRQELQDAFFAAIEYPVSAAAAMNRKILCDSTESHQAYEEIQLLTRQYNELCGGKWRGLMDAAPRKLPVYENVHGHLTGIPANRVNTIHACDYAEVTGNSRTIQMLGRSMKAVSLQKNGVLTYRFDVEEEDDYVIRTALIPTQPNDNGDLRFSVGIDGQEPTVYSLKEPFRSERWKENVLNGQAVRDTKAHLSKGSHTLTIRALDNHIVFDLFFLLRGNNG